MEGTGEHVVGPGAWRSRARSHLDGADQAEVSDVDHVRQALQRVQRLLPVVAEAERLVEEVLLLVGVQRGERGGTGQRMAGVGVAMEHVDGVVRAAHEGVEHAVRHEGGTHRHAAVGDALGGGDHVRRDAEALCAEGVADAAEAGDHFVEDQQDAVLVADLAQALQVAHGRDHHTG